MAVQIKMATQLTSLLIGPKVANKTNTKKTESKSLSLILPKIIKKFYK
jgi:hypothetical protein